MRRAIVGNSVGVKSVFMLALALVVIIGAGPAFAQSFRTLSDIKYQRFGSTVNTDANGTVISASAILSASDADNDVFKNGYDGKIDTANGVTRILNNGTEKTTLFTERPILANIEPGDQLFMAAIIEGVTESIVTDLRNGPADKTTNSAMAQIIGWVTADFSPGLFSFDTASSVYTNVQPSYATTTRELEDVLDLVPAGQTFSTTTVIVYWDIASLTVSATDQEPTVSSHPAAQSFSATMALFGGGSVEREGKSNFIGIETGINSAPAFDSDWTNDFGTYPGDWQAQLDQAGEKGNVPGSSIGIRISKAYDFTSRGLYGPAKTIALDPAKFIATSPSNVPFQFRKNDQLNIELRLDVRETLDGEPDEYFNVGVTGSDPLELDGNGVGESGKKFLGGKLVVTAQKTSDQQNVFSSTIFDATNDIGTAGFGLTGSNRTVAVTASIADTVVTSGSYRVFVVQASISDEVGSSTSVKTNHAIDVAEPFVTAVRGNAEGDLVPFGDIGVGNTSKDDAVFGIEVDGNGELSSTANVKQWLGMQIQNIGIFANGSSGIWNTQGPLNLVDLMSGHPTITAASIGTLIDNIPSTSKILGGSVTITIKNNVSSTINSGGLIVSVSDDARNPAIVFRTKAADAIQSASVNTTITQYSITDFTPIISNTLSPATVEIDNSPPSIISATFSVTGLPSGYFNDGSINTADVFARLVQARETTNANVRAVYNDGTVEATQVIRGTARITEGATTQNGSPVRLLVQFQPTVITDGNDLDGVPFAATNKSERVSGMLSRFNFQFAGNRIGYATNDSDGDGVGDNVFALDPSDSRWVLDDATIVLNTPGDFSTAVGWATYFDNEGIPMADGSGVGAATNSIPNASMFVNVSDRAINYAKGVLSNSIIVSVSQPIIARFDYTKTTAGNMDNLRAGPLAGAVINGPTLVQGDGNPAKVVLLVTNTNGSQISAADQQGKDARVDFRGKVSGTNDRFLNSADIVNATAPEVQAGYTIIVGTTFTIRDGGTNDSTINQLSPSTAGFPFLLNNLTSKADTDSIDGTTREFGRTFRTLSVDFSDFIDEDSAKDVLPDVSNVVGGGAIETAAPGDVVAATWFLFVDGTRSLKLLPVSDVRDIVINARDLSGNVSRLTIPVATASFAQPLVQIINYELDIPSRGVQGAVVQRTSDYLGGVNDAAAFTLSQATMNINDASILLVAKIGDGVNKGGPFKTSNFITADFSAFGGSSTQAPDDITLADGTAVTDGLTVGAADIVWATWYTSKFAQNPGKDTAGAKTAKISITATASTGGIGKSADSSGIQVDHTMNNVVVGDILEQRASDGASTAPSGDVVGDGIVRPNQIVSVTGSFQMDTADLANANPISFGIDTSEFGTGISSSQFKWTRASDNHRGATFQFSVPSSISSGFYKVIVQATDAAGNSDRSNGNLVTVNATVPQVQSLILAASNAINYATDNQGIVNAFRVIGTREISDPSNPTINEATALVRGGDTLMVTATVKINDDVFTDLDISADFSQFAGDNYKRVVPAPYSSSEIDAFPDLVGQATRVAGNILFATWVFPIPAGAGVSVLDASVIIDATNPAGTKATGLMTQTVPLTSDNTGPEITAQVAWWKNGKAVTGEVNPNNIAGLQPGDATASLVVAATYTDAGVRNGFAPSVLSALMFGSTSGAPLAATDKAAEDTLFDLSTNSNTDDSDPEATFWAFSDKSGVFRDSGSSSDGPVIASDGGWDLSDINVASASADELKASTASVLNVWYGVNPLNNVGSGLLKIKANRAKDGANFTFSAIDSIGNKTSQNTDGSIEIDGKAPTITTGYTNNLTAGATMSIAPGQTAFVDYIPALYSGATLLRPTRVSKGTVVRLEFNLFDDPDRDDDILLSIDGNDFTAAASSMSVISPTADERTDQSNKDGEQLDTLIHPSVISGNIVSVTVDLTVNAKQEDNKAGDSTIPLDTSSVSNALAWGTYLTGQNKITAPTKGSKSAAIIDVTDTVDNNTQQAPNLGFEIDTEGPGVIEELTVFRNTLADVNNLVVPGVANINARAGTWLVFAATLVVDGSEDAHFPLDKFTVNWKEIFEFDTNRLEDSSLIKGKQLIVASATRSILFVTQAIKINDDADPRNPDSITYHLEDAFGNVTEKESGSTISISAEGPQATEISLKVDGIVDQVSGVSKLGIGNKWPDSASAAFEITPGAVVVLEATITTNNGEAPDTILADFSDLYPAGIQPMVDELVPSATEITPFGTVYARWEYLAFDVTNLLPGTAINPNNVDATKTFFDHGVLNEVGFNVVNPAGTLINPGNSPIIGNGKPFNGPIKGATPASEINLNGIASGFALTGGPRSDGNVADNQDALDALIGLPSIVVQPNAAAKRVAWVTVFVGDSDSLFNPETSSSSQFAVDTEPPRANVVFSVTQALTINNRFTAGLRIGFPTAPNADRNDIFAPAPRVRQGDSVAVILEVTNPLIDGSGNDAFRGIEDGQIFRIDADDDTSIQDLLVDLSGFSTADGVDALSVFDPDAPIADPSTPNILTIDSQGTGMPDLIHATYTIKVTGGVGTTVIASNDPVEVTVTVLDDAGNLPVDTLYDKKVMLDNNDGFFVNKNPGTVLAVDNNGPSISGSVVAQIIDGTALVDDPLTGGKTELTKGALLEDEAVIAAGSVLRVTVTVTDLVDHPLDLIIDQNNFGEMQLVAEGLKLTQSKIDKAEAFLSGPDSISVPFEVTVPDKDTGKSTFSFQFVIRATDTVGNMTEKRSIEKFGFDANPDIEYFDADGNSVTLPTTITVNADPSSREILSAKGLDVGGIQTIEWIPSAAPGVTFTAFDDGGNEVSDLKLDVGGSATNAQLDLFATIPVITGGVTPFDASAVVTDIDGNTNEAAAITVNINQPPVIAASLPYQATNDVNQVTADNLLETLGLGYNTAFEDIREVTIEEGTVLTITVSANDSNVGDTVTLSATGTAITDENIEEGLVTSTPGSPDGTLDFSFKPGFLAVTGDVDSATFALDVQASDGSTIAADTSQLIFNVLAKSATPVVEIVSIKINDQSQPASENTISLNEGQTLEIVVKGQDPGNEQLTTVFKTDPEGVVPADIEVTTADDGIVYGTLTYEAGFQDADVPALQFESQIDPFFASFTVANASFDNKILIPVDVVNVSQAPVISATASIGVETGIQLADGDVKTAKAGDQVQIEFNAVDPDGDAVITSLVPTVTLDGEAFAHTYTAVNIGTNSFESLLSLTLPALDTVTEPTLTIVYTARDVTLKERTATYSIFFGEEEPVGPETKEIDELLVAQGFGGTNTINWKNIDPNVTEIVDNEGNTKTVAITSSYRSVAGAAGDFLDAIGGGADRAAYVNTGDVDGDGDVDIVITLGPITDTAVTPNIVVVKDGKTRQLIGNSFAAFQTTGPVGYTGGEIRTAVGKFMGSSTDDQIAVAQGIGGDGIVRIYQYTGLLPPNGFAVASQFDGLVGAAKTNNASGGVVLAAGDLDGDGTDELIIGQTNSDDSRSQFSVVKVNDDGTITRQTGGVAFSGRQWQGNGGIEIAVADLDGNGDNELVFAQTGNTQNFGDDRDSKPINLISVLEPVVENGAITGYAKPTGNLRNVFPSTINPSGSQTIAAIEANGLADGDEVVIGTNAILTVDGMTVTATSPAPQAKYTIVSIDYDGTTVSGVSSVSGLGQAAVGFPAFPSDFNPTSGGVYVGAGNTD